MKLSSETTCVLSRRSNKYLKYYFILVSTQMLCVYMRCGTQI